MVPLVAGAIVVVVVAWIVTRRKGAKDRWEARMVACLTRHRVPDFHVDNQVL